MHKPQLYLFVGYPGAGKTTVAQIIAQQTDAVHIWADLERHKKFGRPTHAETESHELYNELNERASELLAAGQSVIFDTNFNHLNDRRKLEKIAQETGAEAVVVWVNTPYATALDRAVCSNVVRNGYDFVMDEAQFKRIADKLEPPTEDEKVLKIDGTKVDEQQIAALLHP